MVALLAVGRAVALRKESVDRNNRRLRAVQNTKVALRKESVDRNIGQGIIIRVNKTSLSARRAWIEILISSRQVCLTCVALRKESVDRNCRHEAKSWQALWSLSARRAWIEIGAVTHTPIGIMWSLSARRAWIEIAHSRRSHRQAFRRSPQGERG